MASTALVLLPVLVYALLHLGGWLSPLYLWGADQFHYYPSWTLGLLLLAALPACLGLWQPRRFEAVDRSLTAALERIPSGRSGVYQAVFLAAFFFACWLWRVEAYVLGDSAMWLQNLEILRVPGQEDVITWIIGLPWEGYRHLPALQALDFAIHLQAYRWGYALFGWTAADAYAWISICSGVGYAAVLWRLAVLLGRERWERLTLLAYLLSLGNVQFFFGYGESYTLIALTMALYALWALRYLRGQTPLWVPTAALVATLALHLMPMALAPSWLYLLWRHPGRLGAWLRRPSVCGPLALVGAAAALALYVGFYSRHHLPFWTPEEEGRFAVFSLPHLTNLSNQVLLLSPFALVWGAAAVWRRRPATAESRFLGWAALAGWGLVAVHNITMGGRDWDLMAMPCLFYALWGMVHLLGEKRAARLRLVRLGVLPVALLHTALWVGINADEGQTKARLENLLRFGPNQPTHYQEFTLGYQYSNIKEAEYDKAAAHYRRALETYAGADEKVRWRYRKYLGTSLVRSGRYAAADSVFSAVYGIESKTAEVWDNNDLIFWRDWLNALYAMTRMPEVANEALWSRMAKLGGDILTYEEDADVALVQGVALFRLGEYEKAVQALRQSLALEDDPTQRYEVTLNLGRVLVAGGQLQEAVVLLRQAEEEFPREAGIRVLRGEILRLRGEEDEAAAVYHRALELQPGRNDVRRSLALLLLQQGEGAAAAAQWRHLLENGGDATEARTNLGWSLYLQGEYAAAVQEYRLVLEQGANAVAHFNLGLAQLAAGDTAAAARTYEAAVSRHGIEEAKRTGATADLAALATDAAGAVQTAAARILSFLKP